MGNRELKQEKVAKLTDSFKNAQASILTSYIGITVEEDTELRKKMREEGVDYRVVKNSLAAIAAKEAGFEGLDKEFVGPVAIAFSYEDPTKPARILADFAKNHKAIALKAGIVQGQVFDQAKVMELSTIPPKEVLIAKLLGSLKSPVSKFVYVLDAVGKKKEEASA